MVLGSFYDEGPSVIRRIVSFITPRRKLENESASKYFISILYGPNRKTHSPTSFQTAAPRLLTALCAVGGNDMSDTVNST